MTFLVRSHILRPLLALILLVSLAWGGYTAHTATVTAATGTTFDDEFNAATVDTTAWAVLSRSGDSSNFENEYYTPANVADDGNNLAITINKDTSHAGAAFASGMVQWRTFNFQYGTVEIRAKFPAGAWPALWFIGLNCQASNITSADNHPPCNWDSPGSEEIDLAEIPNSRLFVNEQIDSTVLGTPSCFSSASDVSAAFHVYSMVWTAASVTWLIDGVQTCKINKSPSSAMFLIMNVAMTQTRVQISGPQQLLVDYVRVTPPGAPASTATPSSTRTSTRTRTATATMTATNTPVPPTSTSSVTATATATNTPLPTDTATDTATVTPLPTATACVETPYGCLQRGSYTFNSTLTDSAGNVVWTSPPTLYTVTDDMPTPLPTDAATPALASVTTVDQG